MAKNSNIFRQILLFSGLFLVNFGALALGGFLMGGSPASNDWYISLNKAPWTPPGWVFGFAWTFIMICFTIYMFKIIQIKKTLNFTLSLFVLQWVLNVVWNPLFFYFHWPIVSFLTILLLLLILLIMFIKIKNNWQSNIFLLPYILWIMVATSMNLFIVLYN